MVTSCSIGLGHEVMMDRCWLGETNFDFDHEQHGVKPNATAIQINGNDHYILNTIVFSSLGSIQNCCLLNPHHMWCPSPNDTRTTFAWLFSWSWNQWSSRLYQWGACVVPCQPRCSLRGFHVINCYEVWFICILWALICLDNMNTLWCKGISYY